MIGLTLLAVSLVLAVVAYFTKLVRLYVSGLAAIVCGAANGYIFSDHPTVWGCVSLCFGIFQVFNIARLIKSRLHAKHMRKAFFNGGLRLLLLQFAMLAGSFASVNYESFDRISIFGLRILQVVIALAFAYTVMHKLVSMKADKPTTFHSDKELPSISVLIPARNEDKNLEELLRTVVANDYPKLEIIVLDDNSNTPRVSEIVKGFAQDGVRFVNGDPTPDNWLAKNWAYETLARNASGDYLAFMGVDVRLGITTLRSLVEYSLSANKTMLSVMPTRHDPAFWWGFFTPLRYMRELLKLAPRFGGASTLSTLWLIKRTALDGLGGFAAVTRKVIPEQYLATQLALSKNYAFIRSNSDLQVSTAKDVREQIETSIRVAYPAQHRRMEYTAVASVALGVFVFLPFIQLPHALFYGEYVNALLSGIAVLALAAAHLSIVTVTNPLLWPLAVVNMPYLVLQEITLSVISMYRYEFGEVLWKGRSISQPVMQVIPHLPALDSTADIK